MKETSFKKTMTKEEKAEAKTNTRTEVDTISRLEKKWEEYVSFFRKGKKERALAEAKARAEAEAKAKAEAQEKARAEAEAKAKSEAEKKARVKAEAKAKANIKQVHNAGETEFLNNTLWQQFYGANTDEKFCHSWLGLLSSIIGGISGSVVVLGPSEKGPFRPISFWPADTKKSSLTTITNRVLKEQKSFATATKRTPDGKSSPIGKIIFQLASPVKIDEKLYGVVALEITERPQNEVQSAIRHIQWGIAWLEKWIINKDTNNNSKTNERLACAVDLVAHTLQEDGFQAAATSFVTLVATSLGCDRVSIGFIKGKNIKVQAISHSAQFKKQMNLLRSICSAMEESVDQQKSLIYPSVSKDENNEILYAHDKLAKQQNHVTICTIPFIDNKGDSYGALTLERSLDKPFDTGTVELCDSITALVAPILEEKRMNDRLLIKKIWESLCLQVKKLTGSGRMAIKLFAVLSFVMVCFFTFANGEYRITAKSTMEGKVQHAIVAPYDGYISESYVQAGDSVKNQQIMCKLDDRDFRLEHTKLKSERAQYSKQHREAMAVGKRADMKILKEQINQANTQLALLDEQLSRTNMIATFDGFVVSGDLSQSLGAPVERGQVLFEISPLNDYRVRLDIDEREISRINVGQTGNIVLNALPKTQFPITIEKITPVSAVEEGVNFFRVVARLDKASENLRPGMEGFGKINVGRNKLIWILTHSLTDWLRLWAWSWWP